MGNTMGVAQALEIEELLGPLNEVEHKNAPRRLWVAGDHEILRSHVRVSIVGTRRPSPEGRKRAAQLARDLVGQGIAVLSGLAEGIDTVAHETAMSRGGKTIAVLGTPLDHYYPQKNEALQRCIMEEHLALSQFPTGTPLQRKNFPQRNRTMALVSHATVIVEAGDGSGTLHQGWEALRLNRPLFMLRSVAENPLLQWPSEMLRYGAIVLSESEEVFEQLPSTPNTVISDLGLPA